MKVIAPDISTMFFFDRESNHKSVLNLTAHKNTRKWSAWKQGQSVKCNKQCVNDERPILILDDM